MQRRSRETSAYDIQYRLACAGYTGENLRQSSSNDSKELLATREASKHQKYDGQCATVGITFKTFIFGSLGGFGEEATVFIKELGRRVARVNATLASDEIAKIRRLLSHIIQQRQANACIRRGKTADVLVY